MDESGQFPAAKLQQLWHTLEAASAVRHRGEMFLWAQGALQALIPHGLMLALLFDAEHKLMHSECLQAVLLDEQMLESLRDPQHGLLGRIERCCHELGLLSLELPADPAPAPALAELSAAWSALGLGPALFQGSGALTHGVASFFALSCLKQQPDAGQRALLQVLLPQLHLALARSQRWRDPHAGAAPAAAADAALSERQLEILHWVKLGKTNHEISLILAISELTVKNHLQKVFKKLDVHNRAQAVAKVMSLRLD